VLLRYCLLKWLSQARRVNGHIQYMCLGCPKPGEWPVIYSICVLAVTSQESEWSYTIYVSWLSQARRVNGHILAWEDTYTVYDHSLSWLGKTHILYMTIHSPGLGRHIYCIWPVIYSICVFPSQESEWSYTVYVSWVSIFPLSLQVFFLFDYHRKQQISHCLNSSKIIENNKYHTVWTVLKS
jgi:hypothetical protein